MAWGRVNLNFDRECLLHRRSRAGDCHHKFYVYVRVDKQKFLLLYG